MPPRTVKPKRITPRLPLWVDDLLAFIQRTDEETLATGARVRLWCVAYHEDPCGTLLADDVWLARRAGVTPEQWAGIRAAVVGSWSMTPDRSRFVIRRIQEEVSRARSKTVKAKKSAAARWEAEKNPPGGSETDDSERNANALQSQSERNASPAPAPAPAPSTENREQSVAVPSQVPEGPTEISTATNSLSGFTRAGTAELPPDLTLELDDFELPEDFPSEQPPAEEPTPDIRLQDLDRSHAACVHAEAVLEVALDMARKRGKESIWNDLQKFRPIGTFGLQRRAVIEAPRAAAERVLAWLARQINQSAADSMRKRLLIIPDEERT